MKLLFPLRFFIAAAGQDPYVKTAALPDMVLQSSRECASTAIPKVNEEVEDSELRYVKWEQRENDGGVKFKLCTLSKAFWQLSFIEHTNYSRPSSSTLT